MTIDQNLIAKITAEVMARVQAQTGKDSGDGGIFATIDQAVAAARTAQKHSKTYR